LRFAKTGEKSCANMEIQKSFPKAFAKWDPPNFVES